MAERHTRGPSIDSQTFAVPDLPSEGHDSEDEFDTNSESSYAGSGEAVNENEFSPVRFLQDSFARALDPGQLDRAVVTQAQTSGMVNAKSQELQQLQTRAAQRLQEVRGLFGTGMKNARRVQKDLDQIEKRLRTLTHRAKMAYPIEYQHAQERVRR